MCGNRFHKERFSNCKGSEASSLLGRSRSKRKVICLFFLFFSWEESDPARIYQQGVRLLPYLLEIPPSEASQQFLQAAAAWRGLAVKGAAGLGTDPGEVGVKSGRCREHRGKQSHPRHLEGPVNLLYGRHTASGKCYLPAGRVEPSVPRWK